MNKSATCSGADSAPLILPPCIYNEGFRNIMLNFRFQNLENPMFCLQCKYARVSWNFIKLSKKQ